MSTAVQNSGVFTDISDVEMIIFLIKEVSSLLAVCDIYIQFYSVLIDFNERFKRFADKAFDPFKSFQSPYPGIASFIYSFN